MTIRDPNDDAMTRKVRPKLSRTGPQRSIVNAFYQPDGEARAQPKRNGHRFEDDAVWGVSSEFGAARPADDEPEAAASKGPLWNNAFDAVRSAYGVVNEQIREGYEEAARLSQGDDAPKGNKLTAIVNRLVQTYSDLGTQWVDLIRATAAEREVGPAPASSAPPADMSLAVELTTARRARARALLYRPAQAEMTVWPLRQQGGDAEIAGVTVEPGPVVAIEIAADTPPGLYRGIVIEDGVEDPVGSVIVTVIESDDG